MVSHPQHENAMAALRAKAEQLLQLSSAELGDIGANNRDKMQRLLHELSVHQVELEMQQDELLKANYELNEARIQAEKSRDQFSMLFNRAPISFVVLDKRGIIRQCNQAFSTLIKIPNHKLIGRTLTEFVDKRDRLLFDTHVKHLAQNQGQEALEIRIAISPNISVWVSFSAISVDELPLENGEQASVLAELTNIDQIKKTQQYLEESRLAAEQANKAKSQFLSNMSHELRTPLNAILGFAQLIEMETALSPEQELYSNTREIIKAGDHLLALIENVLDLSRVESGHLLLQPGEVYFEEMLNDAIGYVREMARQHDVTIMVDHGAKEARVYADIFKLRQVVLNLLTNGIKYNRPSGLLHLRTKSSKDWIWLYVQDEGEGISNDKVAGLFQPFNRLGKEYTAIAGTGVGLALSKQLIEQMGGELGLVSCPHPDPIMPDCPIRHPAGEREQNCNNRGATFWIKLPVLQQGFISPEQPDIAVSSIGGLKARILYIEDDERSVRILQAYFAKKADGVELLIAATAGEGIDIAIQQRPDLILCDINLEDHSGFEVARILKNHVMTQAIPVVALTANAMTHDIETGEQCGFDAYLTKPVNWDKFDQTLSRLIGAENANPARPVS